MPMHDDPGASLVLKLCVTNHPMSSCLIFGMLEGRTCSNYYEYRWTISSYLDDFECISDVWVKLHSKAQVISRITSAVFLHRWKVSCWVLFCSTHKNCSRLVRPRLKISDSTGKIWKTCCLVDWLNLRNAGLTQKKSLEQLQVTPDNWEFLESFPIHRNFSFFPRFDGQISRFTLSICIFS